MTASFDAEAFFDGLATRLHEDGTLKTYDTPRGKARGWEGFAKTGHCPFAEHKDTPGQVFHIGDEPYSALTTPQVSYYNEIPIQQADIALKVASVRSAIARYMPTKDFETYLTYFVANLHNPSHKEAMKRSLENIRDQVFAPHHDEWLDEEQTHTLLLGDDSNAIRDGLGRSVLLKDAKKHPEMVLGIALYQAAHMSYLSQLDAAIKRNPAITEDERNNAGYTITSPMHQFTSSLLFSSLLPLALFEHRERCFEEGTEAQQANSANDMKIAIHKGWEKLFDKKVLIRTFNEVQIKPQENERGGGQMECPARKHMQESMQHGLVEKAIDHVFNHRKEMEPLLQETYKACAGPSLAEQLNASIRGMF